MTTPAALLTLSDTRKFLLAGHAIFTLVSKKTGARKTFCVRANEDGTAWFVDLLIGPENSTDYRYLGFMYSKPDGLRLKINKDGWGEEAAEGFRWMLRHIEGPVEFLKFHEQAEFWHAGMCGRCGHLLTDPESIARGLGPICAEK